MQHCYKNADSKHGRVVDLPAKLAAVPRDFVGTRHSGLVFCEGDGSQISQRDILKYSLDPIPKKLPDFTGTSALLPQMRQYANQGI